MIVMTACGKVGNEKPASVIVVTVAAVVVVIIEPVEHEKRRPINTPGLSIVTGAYNHRPGNTNGNRRGPDTTMSVNHATAQNRDKTNQRQNKQLIHVHAVLAILALKNVSRYSPFSSYGRVIHDAYAG